MNLGEVSFLTLMVLSLAGSLKGANRYASLDLDTILRNDRILNRYVNCIVDKGPCTAEGRDLKRDLPRALKTNCASCTDSEKNIIKKAATYIIDNKPDKWKIISQHFDPQRQYVQAFRSFLQS